MGEHERRIVDLGLRRGRRLVVVVLLSEFDAHADFLELGHHVSRKVVDVSAVARALSEETERRRLVVALAVETPTGKLEPLHRQTVRDVSSLVYDGQLVSPSRGVRKTEPLDDRAELSRIGVMKQVVVVTHFFCLFLSQNYEAGEGGD